MRLLWRASFLFLVTTGSALMVAAALHVESFAYQLRPQDVDLQAAIRTATVTGDLKTAIQQFKAIVAKYPADRVTVSKALLELAECYRRLGDAAAQGVYQQIVKDYRDQPEAVALARARLAPSESASDSPIKSWTFPGEAEAAGSVSYDGRYIAYVDWSESGKGDLFVHTIGTGQSRRLTESGNVAGSRWQRWAESAAFSRDGRQVAYSWIDLETKRRQIRLVALTGATTGVVRVLADFDETSWIDPYDWSTDGQWIAAMWQIKRGPREIGLVSTKDGSLRPLKSIDRPCACDLNVSLSPDGRHLAFDLPGEDTTTRDIFVVTTADVREIPAVVYKGHDALVGWAPDGQSLIFTSDRTRPGSRDLWMVPFAADTFGMPAKIRTELGAFVARGMTKSGSIYYCRCAPASESDVKVATFDFATGQFTSEPVDAVQRFVGTNSQPFWAPDGKSFAYRSLRPNQDPILAIQDTASGDVRELRPKLAVFNDPRWAPDGRSIMVNGRDFQARFGLYRIDVATGNATSLATFKDQSVFFMGPEMWPGDGRKFYFRLKTGDEISLIEMDVTSGEMKKLYTDTKSGNLNTAVATDGRSAYLRRWIAGEGAAQEFALVGIDSATGAERELIRRKDLVLGGQGLSTDNRQLGVAVGNPPDSPRAILVIPVDGGEPREVMRASGPDTINVGLWAPDSRSMIVRTPPGDGPQAFWWVSLDGRPQRQLNDLAGLRPQGLRLHPDGRRILFGAAPINPEPPGPTELWVLESVVKKSGATQSSGGRVRPIPLPSQSDLGVVSPDGRYMAFKHGGGNAQGNLAIRELASDSVRTLMALTDKQVIGGVNPGRIAWSSDSKQLAYVWCERSIGTGPGTEQCEVRQIGMDGSEPNTIVPKTSGRIALYQWTPDGRHILALREASNVRRIVLINVGDGQVREVNIPGLESDDEFEFRSGFSPDGRYLAYTRTGWQQLPYLAYLTGDVRIAGVDEGDDRPLIDGPASENFVGWTPNGKGVLFTSDRSGSVDLYVSDVIDGRAVGAPVVLRRNIGALTRTQLTPDGRLFFQTDYDETWSLETAEFNSKTVRVTSEPKSVSADRTLRRSGPAWSLDGTSLIYRTGPAIPKPLFVQDGYTALTIRAFDSPAERTVQLNHACVDAWHNWTVAPSADPRSILLSIEGSAAPCRGLYLVESSTGAVKPIAEGPPYIRQAQALAGGKDVVYLRTDKTVVVRSLNSGLERTVIDVRTRAGFETGWVPTLAVSHSGTRAAVVVQMDNRNYLGELRLTDGDLRLIPGAPLKPTEVAWTADDRFLLYFQAAEAGNPGGVFRIPIDGGTPENIGLTTSNPDDVIRYLAVAPDGRRLAFQHDRYVPAGLFVLEDFLPAARLEQHKGAGR